MRAVPQSQMHPTALPNGRQEHRAPHTAGCSWRSCLWAAFRQFASCLHSSPVDGHVQQLSILYRVSSVRKLRPRSSEIFRCLAPTMRQHNLRGWDLYNLLSIIWEVCGSPDLTPFGPNLPYPINTPKNRREDIAAQTKGPLSPTSSCLHSSQKHVSGKGNCMRYHQLHSPSLYHLLVKDFRQKSQQTSADFPLMNVSCFPRRPGKLLTP